MRRALTILLCVLLFIPVCGCQIMPEHPLPILRYQDIVEDGAGASETAVTASRFREDMKWLKDHGYTFVLPKELAAKEIPEKPVLVTFDDGYVSCYNVLFPILRELDVKAAVALLVSKADREDPAYLSWDMCREMSGSGLVEFGSHTYDLHNFDERSGEYVKDTPNGIRRLKDENERGYADRVWPDLYKSIHTIRDKLGTEVCYFSYPFGVSDFWAEGYIRSHFSVTVTTESGIASYDDYRDMPRFTISAKNPVSRYLKS